MELDYQGLQEKTDNFPWIGLVTTGRTGSDFFQSLLDSHPEIFLFNGVLQLNTFWRSSHVVSASEEKINSRHLAAEFIEDYKRKKLGLTS